MPLAGYVCPPGSPTRGTRNTLDHCLGGCPHPCVSPPLLAAIYTAERQNHHKGAYISASMLSDAGCARQTMFERQFDFFEVPTKRWWPFRGTIAHAIIEDCGGYVEPHGWMQELRMSVPLEYPDLPMPLFDEEGAFTGEFSDTEHLVITLGGTTDAYNPRILQLHDFKSLADAKVEMMAKAGVVDEKYEVQLNIYRWLVANTPITPELRRRLKRIGFVPPRGMTHLPAPEQLVIQGFSMMALMRTGYTQVLKLKKEGERYASAQERYLAELRVWDLDEIEAYIRPRALKWFRALVLGQVPPVVDEDKAWLCKNCSFNGDLIEGERCRPLAERLKTNVDLELV